MLNHDLIFESTTSLPECVNDAFNITSLSNPFVNNDEPSYKDDSLICKICLKVMEEIDEILTDPTIEDKVSCGYCNYITTLVINSFISLF